MRRPAAAPARLPHLGAHLVRVARRAEARSPRPQFPESHADQIRDAVTWGVNLSKLASPSSDLTNRSRGRSLPAIAAWIWLAATRAGQAFGVASNRSGLRLATRSPT